LAYATLPRHSDVLMEMVLADIVWSKCLVYLDDILAFEQDFAGARANLRAVFEWLRRANLKLKPSKCNLFAASVEYLGHEVDKDGIRPSRAKVQALHNWATPKSLSEVRTYLGFTGYYRRFVPNYSDLPKPLTELTMKGVSFKWGKDQQAAFEEIKDCIEKIPLLYYPLPDRVPREGGREPICHRRDTGTRTRGKVRAAGVRLEDVE
jgi:hypothetical protein